MKPAILAVAAALVFAVPAFAQNKPADTKPSVPVAYPPYGRTITLAEAKTAAAAAETEARKNGWNMVITIVEPNGAMVLSQKMDGTQYGSNDVARRKAETAANFKRPTSFFQDAVKGGTLNAIFSGALAIEGGELLIIDNVVVGAIGVSGGTGAQDGQVARVAAAAIFKWSVEMEEDAPTSSSASFGLRQPGEDMCPNNLSVTECRNHACRMPCG